MAASRTLPPVIPEGYSLPHHNTHLKKHSWLHRLRKDGGRDNLVVFSTYQFIIASLDDTISKGILAKSSNDVVKILTGLNM